MYANGCGIKVCQWPQDHHLDIQPVEIDLDKFRARCDCYWDNFIHPPTQRVYDLCMQHMLDAERHILGNIKEDLEVTQWQISQTSIPPTKSHALHG